MGLGTGVHGMLPWWRRQIGTRSVSNILTNVSRYYYRPERPTFSSQNTKCAQLEVVPIMINPHNKEARRGDYKNDSFLDWSTLGQILQRPSFPAEAVETFIYASNSPEIMACSFRDFGTQYGRVCTRILETPICTVLNSGYEEVVEQRTNRPRFETAVAPSKLLRFFSNYVTGLQNEDGSATDDLSV